MSRWLRNSAIAALAFCAVAAAADDAIQVTAIRHPVDKSYRRMVQGMDLFEEMRALAPNASLRYRLYPRKRDTDMRIGALHVVGQGVDVAVPVAADNTFTLRRNLADDAAVRSERRADSMTWRADIRTPGLPPDTRRLGDLRLECLVGVEAGLISQYPGVLGRFLKLLETPSGFCGASEVPYLFFADRALFSVALRSGERRQVLSVGHLYGGLAHGRMPEEDRKHCDCEALVDRAYTLPLGDPAWPDDTLVELTYMDAAVQAGGAYAMFVGSGKDDIRAALGEATPLRFENGYEVWAYDFGPTQKPRLEREELVLLFDRRNVVVSTRLR